MDDDSVDMLVLGVGVKEEEEVVWSCCYCRCFRGVGFASITFCGFCDGFEKRKKKDIM